MCVSQRGSRGYMSLIIYYVLIGTFKTRSDGVHEE